MLKSTQNQLTDNELLKKRPLNKRAHSMSPTGQRERWRSPSHVTKNGNIFHERKCQSLTTSVVPVPIKENKQPSPKSTPNVTAKQPQTEQSPSSHDSLEKNVALPQCVLAKVVRVLATKKREFIKMRKAFIQQQNTLLENYAQLKEMESRAGVTTRELGDIRILSMNGWPAHDLLLLIREDLEMPINYDLTGKLGPHVLAQINSQLNPIPAEVASLCEEIMSRRIDIHNLLKGKSRSDRGTYFTNLEWKTKNSELDHETDTLHRMVAGSVENLRAKINYSLELAKVPWVDRDTLIKKFERVQKENLILQHKIEEIKKENNYKEAAKETDDIPRNQVLNEELAKERAERESLKETVTVAQSMLNVARGRIATLERQVKETKTELDTAHKKYKDLEQLFRHRESSYTARSKKLLEVSKTGEITIEKLSLQRDALEIRVKELREQAQQAEQQTAACEVEERARIESLHAKIAQQEKIKTTAQNRVTELETKVQELGEQLVALRERSLRLVDMERKRCLDYVPTKESEPSDRETEIWKELQATRGALSEMEEDLRQCRADKDSFFKSLSDIAQGEGADHEKLATELLDRERKITKLQLTIAELQENEKLSVQTMTQYENKLASLRLEVSRLRNYECYQKEVTFQDLQTELLELHMQVDTLSRERNALVTAAASHALILERHERSADMFACIVRARQDLAALLDGRHESSATLTEIPKSLSSMCTTSADTWSAIRAERARVLRLESVMLAQGMQLEREGRVRTQLERRRAKLEREILKTQHFGQSEPHIRNLSLVQDLHGVKPMTSLSTSNDNFELIYKLHL